jgi:hypothetical protein
VEQCTRSLRNGMSRCVFGTWRAHATIGDVQARHRRAAFLFLGRFKCKLPENQKKTQDPPFANQGWGILRVSLVQRSLFKAVYFSGPRGSVGSATLDYGAPGANRACEILKNRVQF